METPLIRWWPEFTEVVGPPLDESPRQRVGKPFAVDGFSQWMRTAVTATGLPLECEPHGLRRPPGCTANEIMSVRGRSQKSSVARVTPIKRSRQTLSQNWKDTRHTDTRRADFPKPKPRFGKKDKNRRTIKVNKWRVALPRGLEPLFSP